MPSRRADLSRRDRDLRNDRDPPGPRFEALEPRVLLSGDDVAPDVLSSVDYFQPGDVQVDDAGNTYIAALAHYARTPLRPFIAKYDAAGDRVWAYHPRVSTISYGGQMAIAGDGTIFATVHTRREVDVDITDAETTLPANKDREAVFVRLDTDANLFNYHEILGKRIVIRDMAATDDGDVLILGEYKGWLDIDGDGLSDLPGDAKKGMFVARLDAMGGLEWLTHFEGKVFAQEIVEAPNGRIVLNADFNKSLDVYVGGGMVDSLDAVKGRDIALVKLLSTGDYDWGHAIGGKGAQYADNLAVDDTGRIHIAGAFKKRFAPDPADVDMYVTGRRGSDVLIARYSGSGDYQFSGYIGGKGSDYVSDLVTSADGSAYLTGFFYRDIDLDPGPGDESATAGRRKIGDIKIPTTDLYVVKLLPDGTFDWGITLGARDAYSASLAMVLGDLLVFGKYYGKSPDFDPSDAGVIKLDDRTAVFLWVLDSDGELVSVQRA